MELEHNNVLYLAEKKYEEIIDIKKNILKEDINSIYPTYESLANIYNEEVFNIKTLIFGLTVNPEPTGKVRDGTKTLITYNKLTTTLMRLDILTKEMLDKARKDISVLDVDTIMAQLYAIKDLPVRFKPQKNKNNFWEPNLLTLEILRDETS